MARRSATYAQLLPVDRLLTPHARAAIALQLVIQPTLFVFGVQLLGCQSVPGVLAGLSRDEAVTLAVFNAGPGIFLYMMCYDLIAVWRLRRGVDPTLNLHEWKDEDGHPRGAPATRPFAYAFAIAFYVLTMSAITFEACRV